KDRELGFRLARQHNDRKLGLIAEFRKKKGQKRRSEDLPFHTDSLVNSGGPANRRRTNLRTEALLLSRSYTGGRDRPRPVRESPRRRRRARLLRNAHRSRRCCGRGDAAPRDWNRPIFWCDRHSG